MRALRAFPSRFQTGRVRQPGGSYCPCAAPLIRLAMVWARIASANPLSATYRALLAWTRWFSFWLAVMYRSAAQPKKKVAMATAKAVRSLYRLLKKPLILPSTMSAFTVVLTSVATCPGCSSAAANRVLMFIASVMLLSARWRLWLCLTELWYYLWAGCPRAGTDIAPDAVSGPHGGIDGQIGQQWHGGVRADAIRVAECDRANGCGGRQLDAHHNRRMPDARILEDHHVARHGDTTLPGRGRGRGYLPPSRLPRIDHPQVESVGGEPHGIDLGVGPAHKTHALVAAIGPGRAARTDLLPVLDHRLREGRRAKWLIAARRFVPGEVAVLIADVSPAGRIHVQCIGHGV